MTTSSRAELLDRLNRVEAELLQFQSEYLYRGKLGKILFGLQTHRFKYFKYLLARTQLFGDWPVAIKTFWGETMTLPLRDADACAPYLFGLIGGPESRLVRYLIQTLPDDAVFFDVGANYGFYSLLTTSLSDRIRAIAFEPNPHTLVYTRRVLSVRPSAITLVESAAGDHVGKTIFFDKSVTQHSGGSTLSVDVATAYAERFQKIEVSMTTLDAYIAEHVAPTIVKIDVDGGEASVFAGAEKLIEHVRPIIALEVWGDASIRESTERVVQRLQEIGYRIHRIAPTGELVEMSRIDFDIDLGKDLFDNFIFLPPHR